jgi:hypothetical protein
VAAGGAVTTPDERPIIYWCEALSIKLYLNLQILHRLLQDKLSYYLMYLLGAHRFEFYKRNTPKRKIKHRKVSESDATEKVFDNC